MSLFVSATFSLPFFNFPALLRYTSVYFQLAYEYTRRGEVYFPWKILLFLFLNFPPLYSAELAKVVPAVAPAAMTVVIEEEN